MPRRARETKRGEHAAGTRPPNPKNGSSGKRLRASGPISRILSSRPRGIAAREPRYLPGFGGDHSSGPPIARRLVAAYPRVWRKRRSVRARNGPSRPSPPIWPCTTRGLPCRGHCCPRGRLLPYRFTLTRRGEFERTRPRFGLLQIIDSRAPAVYFLWHCP